MTWTLETSAGVVGQDFKGQIFPIGITFEYYKLLDLTSCGSQLTAFWDGWKHHLHLNTVNVLTGTYHLNQLKKVCTTYGIRETSAEFNTTGEGLLVLFHVIETLGNKIRIQRLINFR